MTRQDKTPQVASARPRRSPIGRKQRINVRNKEAGYHYRVVNCNLDSDPDRVESFIEQGWEVVSKDKAGAIGDKRVDNPTAPGSSSYYSVGQGTKAVLMRIKDEWYKEDQAAKQAELDEIERGMQKDKSDYGSLKIS